jgi:polysaccharide export outer membrane protein
MENMKFFGRGIAGLALILVGILLGGCETDGGRYAGDTSTPTNTADATNEVANARLDPTTTLLRVGDKITVGFADVVQTIPPIDTIVQEDGSITLIYNQKFQAAGKTIGALQTEIRDRYVPQYFKFMTPTINSQERFYFVSGQVKGESRQVYTGYMTVLGAITSAGGYTDFANKHKIRVTRANGQQFMVDGVKALTHPELNIQIFPGDEIFVFKRLW